MKGDLQIQGQHLNSRFFLGTGRYPNPLVQNEVIQAAEAEVLTFAIRRVNLDAPREDAILQHINVDHFQFLPNTSGAKNAEEAVRIARLARASGLSDWVKVEISVNAQTLLPDPLETLKATETLVEDGFVVLPYISDDPVTCKRLEEAGAAAVMPGGSPIGTGLGLLNPYNLSLIVEQTNIPVILDAGIGTASDITQAMELGVDGVLLNTAVAKAGDPVKMAKAVKHAIQAGRSAHEAGRIPKKRYATASSSSEQSPV